jgi:hypothetical protein
MVSRTFSIDVLSDGAIKSSEAVPVPDPLPLPEGVTLWRVLQDQELWKKGILDRRNSEGVWYWRMGLPEVFTFDGSHMTYMRRWLQELAFALNPGMLPKGFRTLYDVRRAFTNGTGFDTIHTPGSADYLARADYINDLDLDHSDPRFDKSRVCGGALLAGKVSGDWLEVDTLKINQPVTLEWLLARPWLYFTATTVSRNSTPDQELVGNFPQNGGRACWVPLVTTTPVRYPLQYLQRWVAPELPSPYTIYL